MPRQPWHHRNVVAPERDLDQSPGNRLRPYLRPNFQMFPGSEYGPHALMRCRLGGYRRDSGGDYCEAVRSNEQLRFGDGCMPSGMAESAEPKMLPVGDHLGSWSLSCHGSPG